MCINQTSSTPQKFSAASAPQPVKVWQVEEKWWHLTLYEVVSPMGMKKPNGDQLRGQWQPKSGRKLTFGLSLHGLGARNSVRQSWFDQVV
ncbi:hypothetical protein Nepgr_027473 [Nepenthes gracilis]|uniref:Uncharacterized protein n=1 Tax=Nepenthes gracilis TaxID=150966 RepID=A0AAD3T9X6_NEPGR|nr:hypothetical protein Nepgr_027473 [Nepenthes gracilis]